MFAAKAKLDRIERDLQSIDNRILGLDGRISHLDGRLCRLEGMAQLAMWVVPTVVALITTIGTVATVFLSHH
jgi:hypothetical protein